jgi:hypothetical protein
MEPGLHTASGLALEIVDDTISAAQRMMEAATAPATAKKEQFTSAVPAEVKQDHVGTVVPDNLGKGDTSADDYDGFGDMRNEADQFQTQFASKDARGGWMNFGQLPAWGHGAGGGDTWDPGPPTPFTSSRASHTLFHVISLKNAPW